MEMKRGIGGPVRNERGATMMFMIVGTLSLLTLFALAVDVGMILNTRAEAQRAADAAALAGASGLLDAPSADEKTEYATTRAKQYGTLNQMTNAAIPESGVGVQLLEDNTKVRATVGSSSVPLLFARLLGQDSIAVTASADAVALESGTGKCLKPFSIPDYMYDMSDYGALIDLWTTKSDSLVLIGPALGPAGGGALQKIIADPECNDAVMQVGDLAPYETPGEKVGQVMNGVQNLIDLDPTLAYDPSIGFHRNGTPEPNWRASPRVANIALYDPAELNLDPGAGDRLPIQNFATIYFVEVANLGGGTKVARGRIFPALGVADNCAAEGNCATNTFYLRLVK